MAEPSAIYHIAPEASWEAQRTQPVYVAPSLAAEGFIHCTGERRQLVAVADRFYRKKPGAFMILCIAPAQLVAELRWEEADGELFPPLYGPLNCAAVERVVAFPRGEDGTFQLPHELGVSTDEHTD
jgi:uncharacterized protein (DUF952 family)